jgi:hypothetical protein
MPSPADLTCLVVDDGLFVHVAEALARGFKRVLYGVGLRGVAPKACQAYIGKGLDGGVERVTDVFEAARRSDLVIFPDVYTADLAGEMKKQGKPVFGATPAVADLETDRWATRQLIRDVGLPVVKAKRIVGIDALADDLQRTEDKWVKGTLYRGDVETWHHLDWFRSKSKVRSLQDKLGPCGQSCTFVVEDSIDDAVEVGIDAAVVGGVFPLTVSYGYEDKGAGYVGKVEDYAKLPKPIVEVCEKFGPILRERKYTGFLSLEIRVTKTGIPYFIDPACRAGLPPSESYMELFSNWPAFITAAANGKLIDLEPSAKYSAQLQLTSEFAREHFLAWDIPKEAKRWTKLQNHFRQHGVDYNCPNGDTLVGAVTGIGDATDLRVDVLGRAETLKADSLDYDAAALSRLMETIEKGRSYGIDF